MLLTLKKEKAGNLNPPVYNHLTALPDEVLFHVAHGLRHPLAIYNISISGVLLRFQAVLDLLDTVSQAEVDPQGRLHFDAEPLIDAQQQLLESLLSHIDDCYHILRTIHPPVDGVTAIFADRWLSEVRHPTVQAFQAGISAYRHMLASIVNKLKHQHGRLRPVVGYTPTVRITGYYLDGIDKEQSVGPDPDVHPGNTAFSFNRDLRYHFANLIIIASHLKTAVIHGVRELHGIELPKYVKSNANSSHIEVIAQRIATLELLFYPDEVRKPVPHVFFERTGGATLKIEFPSSIRALTLTRLLFAAVYHGDGVSTSFRPPYFQGDTQR